MREIYLIFLGDKYDKNNSAQKRENKVSVGDSAVIPQVCAIIYKYFVNLKYNSSLDANRSVYIKWSQSFNIFKFK